MEKNDGGGRDKCCSQSWFLTGVVVDTWENLSVSGGTRRGRRRHLS